MGMSDHDYLVGGQAARGKWPSEEPALALNDHVDPPP